MRRFEAARPLHFVTAENLGVGDHDHLCFIAQESATQCTEMNVQSMVCGGTRTTAIRSRRFQSIFLPDLGEPLPFAIVVAKHMDGISLARPAMKLGKEFA